MYYKRGRKREQIFLKGIKWDQEQTLRETRFQVEVVDLGGDPRRN